jgi:hypothetical protein
MKKIFITLTFALTTMLSYGQINNLPDSSIVKIDTLIIKLGDKLFFAGDVDSNNNIVFRKVDQNFDQSKNVSIELSFSKSFGTVLTIKNPFDKKLIYKAELYSFKKNIYVETNVYPIQPKIGSKEMWPYSIDTIRLTKTMY